MIWIAPSEKDPDSEALEKRLWAAADQLRANSGLTSQQYSQPVLGLIFLRFAEVRFAAQHAVCSIRRLIHLYEPKRRTG
jgi:type I restriction enzyme M protein